MLKQVQNQTRDNTFNVSYSKSIW